jgi:hypothetical protein
MAVEKVDAHDQEQKTINNTVNEVSNELSEADAEKVAGGGIDVNVYK